MLEHVVHVLVASLTQKGWLRALLVSSRVQLIVKEGTDDDFSALCSTLRPAVAIVDASVVGAGNPIGVVREMMSMAPCTKVVVVLGASASAELASQVVAAGVAGCLADALSPDGMLAAVLAVADGAPLVCSRELWTPTSASAILTASVHLSKRELEMLQLCGNGCRTKEIALRLGVTNTTVETILKRASEKLGARNRTHAVALAASLGLM